MGFDIMGEAPTDKKGEYFRNNVWWWRPLWNYVAENCPHVLTDDDIQQGGHNGGHLINKSKSKAIAERLQELLKTKETQKYAKRRKEELAKLELVKCYCCDGSKVTKKDRVKKPCHVCNGTGKTESWEKSYPFSVENVKEFAKFCQYSGGFRIC